MAQQANPWDQDAIVPAGGGMVITKPASPKTQYEGPQAAANLQATLLDNAKKARDASQSDDPPIDPQTVTYYAQQVLAGAPMPSIGMGKQAAAARQAIMAEVAKTAGARGLNGADLATQIAHYKAGSKQISNLENMAGTIGVNEQTALANGQQFLDRSAELPGQTRFAPVNAVSDWIQRRFGGTTISAMDAAHQTFVNEYAKVVAGSPSGAGTLSDSARREAMDTIQSNASLAQKQAAFAQMKADMANRLTAIHGGINEAYKALTSRPGYAVPDSTQGLNMPGASQNRDAVGGVIGGNQGGGGPSSGGGGAVGSGVPNAPIGGGQINLATGATRTIADPSKSPAVAALQALLRSNAPDSDIQAAASGLGASPASVSAALAFRSKHPGYRGAYDLGDLGKMDVPTTLMQRVAGSAPAALIGSAANAAAAGIPAALAGNQQSMAAMQAAHPIAAPIGDVVGSGLGAAGLELGLGAGAAKLGGGVLSRIAANPITADSLFGSVSGATSNPSDPLLGAVGGGVLGAGAGTVGRKVLGPALSSAGNRVGRMFGRGSTAVASPSTADAMVLGAAEKVGIPGINNALTEARGLGVPMALADTHPELRELAAAAARRSPTAAQGAESTLLARSRGQIDRFGTAVNRDLGPTANIPQLTADLTQQGRTAAGPLYDAAYARSGASSVALDDLMQRPSMQSGIARAYNIAREEGRDPTSLGFDLNQAGEPTLTRVPSFHTLDLVKRGLDDALEGQRNDVTGKLKLDDVTRGINGTRTTLLNRIDAVNPEYAQARAAYAGPAQSRDALARGQDALKLDPDLLKMQVSNQTPEQLAQMQLGHRDALMGQAESLRFSSNPFDGTLGTPAAEQRLSVLYPNNPGVPNLLRQRDLEAQLARTNTSVIGGSQTAQRQIANAAFDSPLMEGALHAGAAMATHGASIPGTAARVAGATLKDRLALGIGQRGVVKADAIAPMLLNTDPAASMAELARLAAARDAYRAYVQNSTGRRLGGMFGAGLGVGGLAALSN